MKKLVFVLVTIFLLLIIVITVSLMGNTQALEAIKKQNEEYETYLEKEIFGTQVLSIINKATNNNIKNEITKDEKGFFIANNENSIKIEIQLLNEGQVVSYQMETIQKVGVDGFIKNFNLIRFKCSKIEYHDKTKKVSNLTFIQLEE